MSFYHHYRGRNIGRLIHFMSFYNRNYVDHCTFVDNKVYFWDKLFATYTWNDKFGEADVPEFTFVGEDADFHTQQQIELRQKAIDDAIEFKDSPAEQVEVPALAIKAIIPKAYRDAYFWNSCDSEYGPRFYGKEPQKNPRFYASTIPGINHKEDRLYFETCLHRYFWDHELSAWLLDGMFYSRAQKLSASSSELAHERQK